MRYLSVFLLMFSCCAADVAAQSRNRVQREWPQTEGALMHEVLRCMQTGDTAAYYDLFPPFDTLWSMVMRNPDQSPEAQKELNNLRAHPQILIEFDPLYNKEIIGRFCNVLIKGEDSGVQWRSTVMARYVLHKQEPSRALEGLDKIAPERFGGYMFVADASTRVLFCIRVAEVQKIKGQFFGGQLLNILEASTIEEFHIKEERERQYFEWMAAHPDSTVADTVSVARSDSTDTAAVVNPLLLDRDDEGDDDDDIRRQVVDRKYYEGLMDNEIPIRMYIRYMRKVPGKPEQYDGLYKLGESKRYVKLEIVRTKEGKWKIEDEAAMGSMELMLAGRTYTGNWINADDNGFDITMTQTGTPPGKMELLDRILDRGLSGRIDESQFDTEEEQKEKAEEAKKEKLEEKQKEKKAKKAKKAKRRKKEE